MTDPRIIALIVGIAILIVGGIVEEYQDHKARKAMNRIMAATPTPIVKGGNMVGSPGWTAIDLDIVARPTWTESMDNFSRKVREQAASTAQDDAWDARLTRAIRKLRNEPTTCTWDHEEHGDLHWMDVRSINRTDVTIEIGAGSPPYTTTYTPNGMQHFHGACLMPIEVKYAALNPYRGCLVAWEKYTARPTTSVLDAIGEQ